MRRFRAAWLVPVIGCVLVGVGCIVFARGCSSPADQLNSSDPATVKQGIANLANSKTDAAVETLVTVAAREDPTTAREAVRAIARINSPAAVKALSQVAATEKRTELRVEATVGLARQSAPEAAQTLRTMVQTEPDASVRGTAAASLSRVGPYRDAILLCEQAEKETDLGAQLREVRAVEQLLGIRFDFDPKAPPQKRRQSIQNMKGLIPMFVKRLQDFSPVKKGSDALPK